MVRAWHFFLTVATTIAVMSYLYYSSDYYAKRSSAGPSIESTVPASNTAAAGR